MKPHPPGSSASGPESRRKFLFRNLGAVGGVVATAALARVTAAHAQAAPASVLDALFAPAARRHRHHGRCFLQGSRVETADGPRKVEDLAIGDILPTVFGASQPIQWISCERFRRPRPGMAWPRELCPVLVARSAIAPRVPRADLFVTYGHALLIDGVLIPTGNLINGSTIRYDDAADRDELVYFHIKLEGHDAVYAEGLPCETLDCVSETADNYEEYVRLYGAPAPVETCAPRLSFQGGRGEIASRLRSLASPWRDARKPNDRIRDRLEERAATLFA